MKSWYLVNLTVTDLASPAGDPFYGKEQEVCSYVFFGIRKILSRGGGRSCYRCQYLRLLYDVYKLTTDGEEKHKQSLSGILKDHYSHKPEENRDN